ncbi:hypothetical protein BJV82DRAFT_580954 [Fennellomyces sp. T-0311]|nr:hypothetical protein BJV82DRAFT_580954 [Fennellomyces sp. T-0311]
MHPPVRTPLENTANCYVPESRSWTNSDEDNDVAPLPQVLSKAITNTRAHNPMKSKMSNAGDVNGSNGSQCGDNSDDDEDERPLKRKRQPTRRSRSQRKMTN